MRSTPSFVYLNKSGGLNVWIWFAKMTGNVSYINSSVSQKNVKPVFNPCAIHPILNTINNF